MFLYPTVITILHFSVTATDYTFPDAFISLQTISSGPVQEVSANEDACDKLIVGNYTIHHLNSNHTYQNWLKGQLSAYNLRAYGLSGYIARDISLI